MKVDTSVQLQLSHQHSVNINTRNFKKHKQVDIFQVPLFNQLQNQTFRSMELESKCFFLGMHLSKILICILIHEVTLHSKKKYVVNLNCTLFMWPGQKFNGKVVSVKRFVTTQIFCILTCNLLRKYNTCF